MKKFVTALGYDGTGYKADIDDLKTLGKPCLVPIKVLNYRHFAVLRGIYQGHVFLTDPWRGDISFTLAEFKDCWYDNVIFMVTPEGGKGLNNLRLREEDLRFISEDSARMIISDHTPLPNNREERLIRDAPGLYQQYNR